jgi:hypothetical protein
MQTIDFARVDRRTLAQLTSKKRGRDNAYRRDLMKPMHWLAVIPFIGMLVGPAVHNEVDPFILGMPFPLGWISVWVVLTAIIMAVVYLIDPANREDAP